MSQAVILAAGCGKRLGGEARGGPKCLLEVGGRTLVEHQLAALAEVGVEEVCLVVGYGAEKVREVLGTRCHFVLNARWADTNSLYSLWLARDWVRRELFLVNSDVLAHPDVFHRVAAAAPYAGLAYDASSGRDEEHMKVWVDGGLLQGVSKCLPSEQSSGENVGVLRFPRPAAELLLREAGDLIAAGGDGAWAPAALDRLVPRLKVRCVDVADLPWTEIDSADDLRAAREMVWPALAGLPRACRPEAAGWSWRDPS